MMGTIFLCVGIAGLIGLSAFFSGSETGFYRLSRFRLRLGVEQNRRFYGTLFQLVRDGQSLMMSILIGNNLINYALTSMVMALLLRRLSDPGLAELYTTALLTPFLFVFGEMIPKILFYHWADVLIPRLTWLLWFTHKIFTLSGAVAALRWISDGLSRLLGLGADTATAVDAAQRHQVFQIIHETREEGLLSHVQREMIERLLQIPNVSVQTVMTPYEAVEKVPLGLSRSMLIAHLAKTSYVRQLVCGPDGDIMGYIPIFEVLGGEQEFSDLGRFVRPVIRLSPACSAIEAMNTLCRKREKIAVVQSPQSQEPLGIVTLTDLVEELTGELAVS